MEDTVSTLTKD